MLTKEGLRKVLETLPGAERVDVVSDITLLATVVSSRFQTMNEAQRQEVVWRHLRQSFDEEELSDVEFVFTRASDSEGMRVQG